jgi:hypothetical protein
LAHHPYSERCGCDAGLYELQKNQTLLKYNEVVAGRTNSEREGSFWSAFFIDLILALLLVIVYAI